MAESGGIDLWEFLDNDMHYNSVFSQHTKETDGDIPGDADSPANAEIKATLNLGPQEDKFLAFMMANRDSVRTTVYADAYHQKSLHTFMNSLPLEIGYHPGNTTDYSWGIHQHNDELKDLLGGREAFKKIKVDYDTALCRLLVYMPGNICPWHYDIHASWAAIHPELNPHLVETPEFIKKLKNGESRYDMPDQHTCDLGKIVRRLVTISKWGHGHMIEMENAFFPRWKSGDVFTVPACRWHLSANAGMKLKMTLIITGVEPEE